VFFLPLIAVNPYRSDPMITGVPVRRLRATVWPNDNDRSDRERLRRVDLDASGVPRPGLTHDMTQTSEEAAAGERLRLGEPVGKDPQEGDDIVLLLVGQPEVADLAALTGGQP